MSTRITVTTPHATHWPVQYMDWPVGRFVDAAPVWGVLRWHPPTLPHVYRQHWLKTARWWPIAGPRTHLRPIACFTDDDHIRRDTAQEIAGLVLFFRYELAHGGGFASFAKRVGIERAGEGARANARRKARGTADTHAIDGDLDTASTWAEHACPGASDWSTPAVRKHTRLDATKAHQAAVDARHAELRAKRAQPRWFRGGWLIPEASPPVWRSPRYGTQTGGWNRGETFEDAPGRDDSDASAGWGRLEGVGHIDPTPELPDEDVGCAWAAARRLEIDARAAGPRRVTLAEIVGRPAMHHTPEYAQLGGRSAAAYRRRARLLEGWSWVAIEAQAVLDEEADQEPEDDLPEDDDVLERAELEDNLAALAVP